MQSAILLLQYWWQVWSFTTEFECVADVWLVNAVIPHHSKISEKQSPLSVPANLPFISHRITCFPAFLHDFESSFSDLFLTIFEPPHNWKLVKDSMHYPNICLYIDEISSIILFCTNKKLEMQYCATDASWWIECSSLLDVYCAMLTTNHSHHTKEAKGGHMYKGECWKGELRK